MARPHKYAVEVGPTFPTLPPGSWKGQPARQKTAGNCQDPSCPFLAARRRYPCSNAVVHAVAHARKNNSNPTRSIMITRNTLRCLLGAGLLCGAGLSAQADDSVTFRV